MTDKQSEDIRSLLERVWSDTKSQAVPPVDPSRMVEQLVRLGFDRRRSQLAQEEQDWIARARSLHQELREKKEYRFDRVDPLALSFEQWTFEYFQAQLEIGLPFEIVERLIKGRFDHYRYEIEGEEKEARRRAQLTPQQRDQEDRQTIAAHYAALGEAQLALESWTLEQITALLAPNVSGLHTGPDEEARRRIRLTLESCVGVSLMPLNPAAAAEQQRFTTADLIRVAQVKQLGYIAVLKPLLASLAEPPAASPPRSDREADVARFVDLLKDKLDSKGITQTEFCERGAMAALYRAYCDHFDRNTKPYADTAFGDRLNRAGFKFGGGARGPKTERYVFSVLDIPKK